MNKAKIDDEIPQAKRLGKKVSIEDIIKACELFYGKSRERLVGRGKGKQERRVAIYLSRVMSGERNREIGRYFGIKGSAVSEVIKGVEGRLGEELRLRKEIESLKGKLIIDF